MLSPSANAVGSKGFPSRGASCKRDQNANETFWSELCGAEAAVGEAAAAEKTEFLQAKVAMLSPSANAVGSEGSPSRGASCLQSKKRSETLPPELCGAEAAVGEAAAAEKTESPHAKVAMLSPSANAYGSNGFPSRGAFSPQNQKRNETFRSELCRADDAKEKAAAETAAAKDQNKQRHWLGYSTIG